MSTETRDERWWDFAAALFFTLAIYFAASRLYTTNWTEYLGRIQLLIWPAAGLGLALGFSRFRPLTSFLFGLTYTLCFVGWTMTALMRSAPWLERLFNLGGRLLSALVQIARNQPLSDPILFLTLMMLLFWAAAMSGGYRLVRYGKPWGGIAAVGALVLVVEYSFDMYATANPGTVFTLLFSLLCILLLARLYYLRSRHEWVKRGSMVENEVGPGLGRGAAIAGLVLVVLAWYSPRVVRSFTPGSTENLTLTAGIQRFRDRFERMVFSLRSPSNLVVESLSGSLGLGTGSNLSEEIVLYAVPRGARLVTSRYYWSGRSYETFEDGQWRASEEDLRSLGPQAQPVEYGWKSRTNVRVEFTSRVNLLRTLYFPGAVTVVSIPVQGISAKIPRGEEDLTALISDPPVQAGETYSVSGQISTPTILALRASGEKSIPDFIAERYLQLPANFSPKIRALAREITQGLDNPYDQVEAITRYLRDNITYETTIPAIPDGEDPLEWFLFTHKAGFCNYYASAEVLMLRARGIPARLTVGYAAGVWNEEEDRFEVRGRDYHAWPEVYFPELGWVPFEPTGNQPALAFPEGEISTESNPALPVPTPTMYIPDSRGGVDDEAEELAAILAEQARRERRARLILVSSLSAGAALLGFGLYKLLEKPIRNKTPLAVLVENSLSGRGWRVPRWVKNWAGQARRSPMERIFAAVAELLRAWGKPPGPNLTPAEQVGQLVGLVPEVERYAAILLEEYERDSYSPRQGDVLRARRAADELRANGYREWMRRRSKKSA